MSDHLGSARHEASCLVLDLRDASTTNQEKALRHIADAESRLSNLRRDLEQAARALGRRPRSYLS